MKLVIEHAVWTQVLDRDPDLIDEAGLLVLDGDVVINFRHDPAIIKDDQGNPRMLSTHTPASPRTRSKPSPGLSSRC